jgi:hypothetical protein
MTGLFLSILMVTAPVTPAAAPLPDTLVVCPPAWTSTLQPWIDYRRGQGHRIAVIPSAGSYEKVRTALHSQAKKGVTKAILLVGDAPPDKATPQTRARTVATQYVPAKVNIHWGSEPLIATDNGYADLDGDGVPDLSIGRIPADSAAELATYIQRVIAYETPQQNNRWRRRINLIAGVGGFGPVTDRLIEATAKQFLVTEIPVSYTTSMTQASWRSPYCPDPRTFQQTTLQRINEGCLFWVYMGHGQRRYLDQIRVPANKRYAIFNSSHVNQLKAQKNPPIAIFLACYTGAYDDAEDCLAEQMLRQPGGPIAVLAGSRVTMPYAMSIMGQGLIRGYFQQRADTLGEVVLVAKQQLIAPTPSATKAAQWNRRMLDTMATLLSPKPELIEAERREHLSLFNLLGDPLLRLPHPQQLQISSPSNVIAGSELLVTVTSPWAATASVELVCQRGTQKQQIGTRTAYLDEDQALKKYNQIYEQANDQVWTQVQVRLSKGSQQFKLAVPPAATGSCFVRIFAEGEKRYALGACPVFINRQESNPSDSR